MSIGSVEYTLIDTSTEAFIAIFLPFKILHSISFIVGVKSAFIPSCKSGTLIVSEKSNPVFNPLILSFIFSLELVSARYIIYVRTFPSILIFPSIISFLYMHMVPLVFTVLNISGFESGTIMSPCMLIISFFSQITFLTFKVSFVIFISMKITSSTSFFINVYAGY